MNQQENLSELKRCSPHHNFSHIYIEREALSYPDTQAILERFPRATTVLVNNYKEIFNRSKQEWDIQKQTKKLILAVKKDGLLYPGTAIAPNFGYQNFFYNSPVMNCLYDCQYCYLQGMYPSANVVIFVNNEDFFAATEAALQKHAPLYLCISYDTDLLAFEGILPLTRRWIEFARQQSELIIEVRTKSSNYRAIADLAPTPNVLLAWTLSPENIVQRYESKTPSLKARLEAAACAARAGWKVRLCFDPMIKHDNWEENYRTLVDKVFTEIPPHKVWDVSIGVFRINREYFKNIKKQRAESELFYLPYEQNGNVLSYSSNLKSDLTQTLHRFLSQKIQPDKIVIV